MADEYDEHDERDESEIRSDVTTVALLFAVADAETPQDIDTGDAPFQNDVDGLNVEGNEESSTTTDVTTVALLLAVADAETAQDIDTDEASLQDDVDALDIEGNAESSTASDVTTVALLLAVADAEAVQGLDADAPFQTDVDGLHIGDTEESSAAGRDRKATKNKLQSSTALSAGNLPTPPQRGDANVDFALASGLYRVSAPVAADVATATLLLSVADGIVAEGAHDADVHADVTPLADGEADAPEDDAVLAAVASDVLGDGEADAQADSAADESSESSSLPVVELDVDDAVLDHLLSDILESDSNPFVLASTIFLAEGQTRITIAEILGEEFIDALQAASETEDVIVTFSVSDGENVYVDRIRFTPEELLIVDDEGANTVDGSDSAVIGGGADFADAVEDFLLPVGEGDAPPITVGVTVTIGNDVIFNSEVQLSRDNVSVITTGQSPVVFSNPNAPDNVLDDDALSDLDIIPLPEIA